MMLHPTPTARLEARRHQDEVCACCHQVSQRSRELHHTLDLARECHVDGTQLLLVLGLAGSQDDDLCCLTGMCFV